MTIWHGMDSRRGAGPRLESSESKRKLIPHTQRASGAVHPPNHHRPGRPRPQQRLREDPVSSQHFRHQGITGQSALVRPLRGASLLSQPPPGEDVDRRTSSARLRDGCNGPPGALLPLLRRVALLLQRHQHPLPRVPRLFLVRTRTPRRSICLPFLFRDCREASEVLLSRCPSALFVTWKKAHRNNLQLRGCIGILEPRQVRSTLKDYALTR